MISDADLEFAETVMPAFIETAKMFSQLSVGAQVLSIGFQEKVLGNARHRRVTLFLTISWFLFLLAIGSGAMYQYTAVHFMNYYFQGQPDGYYPTSWIGFFLQPGVWYAVMMVAFFAGAFLLVIGCAQQLYARTVKSA